MTTAAAPSPPWPGLRPPAATATTAARPQAATSNRHRAARPGPADCRQPPPRSAPPTPAVAAQRRQDRLPAPGHHLRRPRHAGRHRHLRRQTPARPPGCPVLVQQRPPLPQRARPHCPAPGCGLRPVRHRPTGPGRGQWRLPTAGRRPASPTVTRHRRTGRCWRCQRSAAPRCRHRRHAPPTPSHPVAAPATAGSACCAAATAATAPGPSGTWPMTAPPPVPAPVADCPARCWPGPSSGRPVPVPPMPAQAAGASARVDASPAPTVMAAGAHRPRLPIHHGRPGGATATR